MSKKVKLAILRARHDVSFPFINDQACINMIMTNATHHSLLNYWSFNTYGYLDFIDSALFPWVDISIAATDVSRQTQVTKAYDAAKAIPNNNVDDFDAYIVFTYPGRMTIANPKAGQPNQPATTVLNFDGGAGPVANNKPACAIPIMTADHTFMCHETGHVLGFKHSYGVLNNGIDWDGKPPYDEGQVYGDPYDIMSSATFGSRYLDPKKSKYFGSPMFAGPSDPRWPIEPKINMGPAPARAHVHLWDPAAIPANRIRNIQTPVGGVQNIRLYAASSDGSPHLIIVHPVNEDKEGRGRCYIEFRKREGWDLGMDVYGSDLARQGVVVHSLADATNDGVRCWYRGHIIVPVEIDSDLQVAGTPLVVRVTYDDVNSGYVDVEISTKSQRGIDINITRHTDEVTVTNPQQMSTPCGDPIVYGTHILQSLYFYMPVTYGYGGQGAPDASPPNVTWKVNGVAIGGGSGSINVPASVYPLNYSVDPVTQELSLSSNPADRYSVPVEATVTESGGTNPVKATEVFDPPGWYDGFSGADIAKLEKCMSKYLISVRLRRRDLLIPPGPDPYRQQWRDRINKARLQEVVRVISNTHPAEAMALRTLIVMRYGNTNLPQQTTTKSAIQKAVITIASIAAIVITIAGLANVIKNRGASGRR